MEQLLREGKITEEDFNIISQNKKQKPSEEEKRQRQQQYSKNYYDKNKEKIRIKNLARYYKNKSTTTE
jgi:hypothetical protein